MSHKRWQGVSAVDLAFGNGKCLVIAWRRKGINSEQLHQFVADLRDLPVEIHLEGGNRAYSSILRLSCEHQLSSYDAAYLDLAISETLPIATADKNLRAAARRSKIELYDPRKA